MDPLSPAFLFPHTSLSLAWFTMLISNSSFSFSFLRPPGLAGTEGFTLTGLTPRSERSVAEDSSPLLPPAFFELFFEELLGVDVEIFCWRLCEDILLEITNCSLLIVGLIGELCQIDNLEKL